MLDIYIIPLWLGRYFHTFSIRVLSLGLKLFLLSNNLRFYKGRIYHITLFCSFLTFLLSTHIIVNLILYQRPRKECIKQGQHLCSAHLFGGMCSWHGDLNTRATWPPEPDTSVRHARASRRRSVWDAVRPGLNRRSLRQWTMWHRSQLTEQSSRRTSDRSCLSDWLLFRDFSGDVLYIGASHHTPGGFAGRTLISYETKCN